MHPVASHLLPARTLAGLLAVAALAATLAGPVRAAEIIPSIGITKSTDANAGDGQAFGGMALRMSLLPFLKGEGAINYRQDNYGGAKVRQWPVTASLWLVPIAPVYVGGGVGWYRTTVDFPSSLPLEDVTTRKLGTHLGGGVELPLAPKLGLDLQGRYVFLSQDKNTVDVPTTFNPDFWTVSAGLAVRF